LVRQFTTAEAQCDLDLVTFFNELCDLLHLDHIIMVIDVWTHLDFFDFLGFLALTGQIGLFLGLIFELTDVQEFAHGGIGVRGNFNQIEPNFRCLRYRLAGIHDTQILAVIVNDSYFFDGDEIIVARTTFNRWGHSAPGRRGGDSQYSL
jgi:hypothetical protein